MGAYRNAVVNKGDIVLVRFDPAVGSGQKKTRPAVVIQHDQLNKYGNTTIVLPITSSTKRPYPMHVRIPEGVIKVEQIRCVDKQRIHKVIGRVSHTTLQEIKQALLHTTDYF